MKWSRSSDEGRDENCRSVHSPPRSYLSQLLIHFFRKRSIILSSFFQHRVINLQKMGKFRFYIISGFVLDHRSLNINTNIQGEYKKIMPLPLYTT